MVQGHGKTGSKIMFVMDYPTRDELGSGTAGDGSCGRLLNLALNGNRHNLRDFYVTSFGKEYIPMEGKKNRTPFRRMKSYAKEIYGEKFEKFTEILLEEINAADPNIIVPTGELALNVLAEQRNIEKFRGSILDLSPFLAEKLNGRKRLVIPIEHPRTIFEEYTKYAILQCDIRRILGLKDVTDFPPDDSILWVCKSANELQNYFNRNRNPEFATTDIETYLGFITCGSFCCDGKEAVSVPLIDFSIPTLELVLIYKQFAEFLYSGIKFVGQNFKYDLFFYERFGFPVKNIFMDTMLGGHTLYPELPKGLDFYTSIYTRIPYYKDEGKEFDPLKHDARRLHIYNAKDSLVDWIIAKKQLEEMQEAKTYHFFFAGPMKWFHLYRKIESNGMLVDNSQRQILLTYYLEEQEKTVADLRRVAGENFNPNSSDQVAELMYGQMEIPQQKHPRTGEVTTEEDTIEFLLLNVVENPEVKNILNQVLYARKLRGIIKFLTMIIHPDGRVRTIYSLMPETGRTSTPKRRAALDQYYYFEGTKIKKQPYGWPFQTIPKRGFRLPNGMEFGRDLISIFVPTPGWTFVEGDLSQAEARGVAVLAEDWELLEKFDKGPGYVHRETGSWIFNCEIKEIERGSYKYDLSKRGRHGANYGLQPPKLARMATVPISLATQAMETIHMRSPKIRGVYHHKIREQLRKYGYIVTPFGRRRDFFGRPGDEATFREGFAYDPQSTTTDQTKFAMLRIEKKCPWVRFLIESHDSIFAEIPNEHKQIYVETLRNEMEVPIDFREGTFSINYQLKIPIEMKWSETNWQEMRDIQ